ncbi:MULTISPECIES: HAD family hydrolase [Anaerolinea]|uniref:HAD family hydrolase n=1 Tax=Anaerolinea TaxID=233189 RepID=UPI002636A77A|nr:HAD family hydrolase [Anaerolinea thermophila]
MALDISRIQAICFDIDGTLGDSDDQWVEMIYHRITFLKGWFGEERLHQLARWIVMEIESPGNLLYNFLDRLHLDDEASRLFNFLARTFHSPSPKFKLIPGVDRALHLLARHYPLAIVSARDERATQSFLQQAGLETIFQVVVSAHTCTYTKPFPEPVLWAAENLHIPPSACLMVGDTPVDIHAGKKAGAQTVGVLCGFGTEKELLRAGADLILQTTSALPEILLRET